MFRMLIVDDEPIIVEGLVDLFQNAKQLDLEIYYAFDGQEALKIVRELRMDVILTDIEMPEMSGIELQREVARLWTRCKMIFLTGYDDFDYIQEATRNGAIDFVLKTEGDEPILAAVEKAIRLLNEEVTYEQLIDQARNQMQLALPTLQKEYLARLLQGEFDGAKDPSGRFAALNMKLSGKRPVYVVLGRVDEWRDRTTSEDKALFMYSIDNIVKEFFSNRFDIEHLVGEHHRMIWLIQPQRADQDDQAYILGTMEAIQSACKQYLKLVCSFVVSSEPYEWEQLPLKFDRLSLLFERGLGLGNEMLLSDERMFASGKDQVRAKVKRIRMLDHYLAQKDKEQFFAQYSEIMASVGEPEAMQAGLSLEIFYELTAIFIGHLNRLDLFPALSEHMNIGKLLSIGEHATWQEATLFFSKLANLIFDSTVEQTKQEIDEVVGAIQSYVAANLSGDLSLNRLSGLVFLTPFYVSRLYKMKTGKSISDYIMEVKMERSKHLLSETSMKVYEIGVEIGFDSASYFNRFFKKFAHMSPQEFRDSLKRI